jgi:3-mercaptopyruvate sulfurtransferase SseA
MTVANDPLVSTDWLAAHLNDANVKVVDASFKMPGVTPLPKDDYLKAHIPGAVFFDVDAVSDHDSPLPHMSMTRAAGSPPRAPGGCSFLTVTVRFASSTAD